MRKLGVLTLQEYDWGIIDRTETDLIQLISNGKITVNMPVQTNSNRSSFIKRLISMVKK